MNFSPEQIPDLSGRVFLVTGGAAGVGYQTVLSLASRNAKVYMAARSETRARKAMDSIREKVPDANLVFLQLDLADLVSVKTAAESFLKIEENLHGLINNAGIAATSFEMTKDGYEAQFQTNYLSHWLLTDHLLPVMLHTATHSARGTVRIVNVSSEGHRLFAPAGGINFSDISLKDPPFTPWTRYGQSKLAMVLHVKVLNEEVGPQRKDRENNPEEVWVASVHPGAVNTGLLANGKGFARVLGLLQPVLKIIGYYISPERGCLTSLFAATTATFDREDSGAYFVPYGKVGRPSTEAEDMELARKLWVWTEGELGKKGLRPVDKSVGSKPTAQS